MTGKQWSNVDEESVCDLLVKLELIQISSPNDGGPKISGKYYSFHYRWVDSFYADMCGKTEVKKWEKDIEGEELDKKELKEKLICRMKQWIYAKIFS